MILVVRKMTKEIPVVRKTDLGIETVIMIEVVNMNAIGTVFMIVGTEIGIRIGKEEDLGPSLQKIRDP